MLHILKSLKRKEVLFVSWQLVVLLVAVGAKVCLSHPPYEAGGFIEGFCGLEMELARTQGQSETGSTPSVLSF